MQQATGCFATQVPIVQVRAQKLGDLALGADRLGRLLKVASVPVLGLPGNPDSVRNDPNFEDLVGHEHLRLFPTL